MKHSPYPCIWFDGQAKAAATFYCAVFPNSQILEDTPLVVTWELNGQKFMGLNGGDRFRPTEAVSFVVTCDTQQEIDHYWSELIKDGGAESMCGWLKDRFGVSWQIVPTILPTLLSHTDRGERVMQALMGMRKLDIAMLQRAHADQQ